jgi:hypothetical protein
MSPKPRSLALQEPAQTAPAVQTLTPMEMLSQALQNGASLEMMEKLISLQERWQAGQARKAFDEAISAAKSEIPVIAKNKKVGYGSKGGTTSYTHEDLGQIAKTVDPILAKHGLSYRFRSSQGQDGITVTCIVSHKEGHFEETMLRAGADTSGSKNSIQAIGSTISYLSRYTLKLALGLAAADDDDGKAADASGKISEAQLNELIALADQANANKKAFCELFKIEAMPDLPAAKFEEAKRLMQAKIRKLEKEAAPSDDS